LALDWVCACGLGFGGIVLPGSERTVSPKHSDDCDRHADKQLCCDASHSSILSDFDFFPEAVGSSAAALLTASLAGTTTFG
jgi:hypothetical protein